CSSDFGIGSSHKRTFKAPVHGLLLNPVALSSAVSPGVALARGLVYIRLKNLCLLFPGRCEMQTLLQDLLFGARMLWKKPGFTLVAVITLALGIGANTAIFSVVNAVLLRPLPYPEPGRLVMAFLSDPQEGLNRSSLGIADFLAVREQNQSFEKVAIFSVNDFTLPGAESPRVVAVSHGFWRQRLAAEPQIIGRTINLDSTPFTVIGVMPEGFRFPLTPDAELWPVRVIRQPRGRPPY